MTTKANSPTALETPKRQLWFLAVAVLVIGSAIATAAYLNDFGTSRTENRARSNEQHTQDAPVPPTSRP